MLQNLHVKNLALINESEVEFSNGMNILSGETGAGKSIIIGSINLALGEKVQKEMLRDNGESAFVELIFLVEDEKTKKALEELEVELEDDQVILSRKITAGRAVGRVNGEAVSVSRMKEIAAVLIDIHGQHEHQSLLSKKKHLDILDEYAKEELAEKKEKMTLLYHQYKKEKEEWANSNVDVEERNRELSFLEYEVKEIEDAHLTLGEDETLETDFRKFSNGKKIMEAIQESYSLTGEGMESASELLSRALRELSMVSDYDEKIAAMEQELIEIDNLLSDFNHEISGYMSDTEFDDETFYEVEKRLDLINHLKSKYGADIPAILQSLQEKQDRIQVLSDYEQYLEKLKNQMEKTKKELTKLCEEVSEIRKKHAVVLCEAITEALKDLNFLDVQFTMNFEVLNDFSANGIDDAEFMISTNPGEPVKPLGKIASGGELSRIMLAIKTVMAENDHIGTLIFDEIDSGISGRTAQMVSEKMNLLGKSHQIICITHLPQIAAMADSHYLIEKSVENQNTYSRIHRLEEEDSVKELARMLGGVEITDTVLESAREMKHLAYMKK
ncbi:MAG: DNA repair protein RecN [Agathobacter sp.]|nr:DNA repair protein RecN [Agathobacter sp.]MBQ2282891.1 DNA repair protein RecN [Agathobacter sp.]